MKEMKQKSKEERGRAVRASTKYRMNLRRRVAELELRILKEENGQKQLAKLLLEEREELRKTEQRIYDLDFNNLCEYLVTHKPLFYEKVPSLKYGDRYRSSTTVSTMLESENKKTEEENQFAPAA